MTSPSSFQILLKNLDVDRKIRYTESRVRVDLFPVS